LINFILMEANWSRTLIQEQTGRSYRVAAVEKALRVLDVFALPPHRFSLSGVSERTGLSVNQTFRLLQTLVGSGYARQEPETKLYSLGPHTFGLVRALFHGDELVLAARQALDWAHQQTGETVALIVPEGSDGTICVDVRQCAHPLMVAAEVGSRSPHLHAGAVGKVLLAARDDAAIDRYLAAQAPLHRFTARTPITAEAVWAEVRSVRAGGYAVSDQEVAEGMYGIAAPVRDRRGEVAAAVTLSAPVARTGPRERERHRAVVVEAGRRISTNLGFRADAART
jgi:DNA-binding IclR family transcriptional regulator